MAGETPIRPDDHLITRDDAVLVLIDYQPEQVGSIRPEEDPRGQPCGRTR